MPTIYCIGRNFKKHAEELGNAVPTEPMVFLSSPTALRNLQDGELAYSKETFHYEAELVLKINRNHKLGEPFQNDSISGIAFGLDITRRDEQTRLKDKGHPWTTSKSFLGSKPIGTFHSIEKFKDLKNIKYKFYLNSELRQFGDTQNMIFSIQELITAINSFSPLQAGDLIFTGTPEGVGQINIGDQFKFELPQLSITESGTL